MYFFNNYNLYIYKGNIYIYIYINITILLKFLENFFLHIHILYFFFILFFI